MLPIDESQKTAMRELCRRFGVARLELFGSATGEAYDPQSSDVDFLVCFQELPPGGRADAYFGLLEGLQALFGRHVDLVMESAVENPYFLRNIQSTRRTVYAA